MLWPEPVSGELQRPSDSRSATTPFPRGRRVQAPPLKHIRNNSNGFRWLQQRVWRRQVFGLREIVQARCRFLESFLRILVGLIDVRTILWFRYGFGRWATGFRALFLVRSFYVDTKSRLSPLVESSCYRKAVRHLELSDRILRLAADHPIHLTGIITTILQCHLSLAHIFQIERCGSHANVTSRLVYLWERVWKLRVLSWRR